MTRRPPHGPRAARIREPDLRGEARMSADPAQHADAWPATASSGSPRSRSRRRAAQERFIDVFGEHVLPALR